MPLIQHKTVAPQAKLAIWELNQEEDDMLREVQLYPSEAAALHDFSHAPRKRQWLASRQLLGAVCDLPQRPELSHDLQGAPELSDGSANISLSHTERYVMLALANEPIGVDIEQISHRVHRISSRFMHPDELAWIQADDADRHLMLCWAAKESLFKLYRRGKLSFRNQLRLEPFDSQEQGSFEARIVLGHRTLSCCVHFDQIQDHVIVWSTFAG